MTKNIINKKEASELGLDGLVKTFLAENAHAKTYGDKAKAVSNEIKASVDNLVSVGNSLTLTVRYSDGTINGINISKSKKPSSKVIVKSGYETEYINLMKRLDEITEKPLIETITLREYRGYIKE